MRQTLALALVLAGCGIEVSHRPIGPHQYLIEAEGHNSDSQGDVMEAAYAHAAEVCGGGRYRVLDTSGSQRNGAYTDGYGNTQGTRRLDLVLTIECVVPVQAATCTTPSC